MLVQVRDIWNFDVLNRLDNILRLLRSLQHILLSARLAQPLPRRDFGHLVTFLMNSEVAIVAQNDLIGRFRVASSTNATYNIAFTFLLLCSGLRSLAGPSRFPRVCEEHLTLVES
jgi:hypothetical protein